MLRWRNSVEICASYHTHLSDPYTLLARNWLGKVGSGWRFPQIIGSCRQPAGPNARNAAKFEPGVPFARERTNLIIFNGLSLAAWASFPTHGLENPLFLAENAKFIKDLRSAVPGGSLSAWISIGSREKERRSKTERCS